MTPPRTDIDVSPLPPHAMGSRAPLWWGNAWMLAIEGTMFAILIATYYYLRQTFEYWPPPRTHRPDLVLGGVGLAIMLVSVAPMYWINRLMHNRPGKLQTLIGLGIALVLVLAAIVIRFYEFPATDIQWNTNAYGSIVWTLLGVHLMHLLALTCETALLFIWAALYGVDPKHALDISLVVGYWYFVVTVQAVLFVVVYLTPYLI